MKKFAFGFALLTFTSLLNADDTSGLVTQDAAGADVRHEERYVQEDSYSAGYRWNYELPGKSPFQRSHYSILRTFRDVTGKHWESTVRVLQGDHQLSLGIIVDEDGWVVTKSSEVPDDQLTVRFADAGRSEARVVSRRADVDLALLKVEKSGLQPIRWDKSNAADVGSFIATTDSRSLPLAIGVVSVKPRVIRPGQAVLGVRLDESEEGVIAARVLDNGGAAKAGIQEDDIITAINGIESKSLRSIQSMIAANRAGDRIKVTVKRGDETLDLVAQLTDMSIVLGDPSEAEVNGQISARATDFPSAFQHDTVLLPNQCGGPLVDLKGRVVGINIARGGRVHCYALPLEIVVPAVEDMLKSASLALGRKVDGDHVIVDSVDADSLEKYVGKQQ